MKESGVKIILWIFSSILIIVGICFVYGLFSKFFPYNGFFFAQGINFLLAGWFGYSLERLNFYREWDYFKPHKFEGNGKIYRYLGINLFRRFLILIGWEKLTKILSPNVKYNLENLIKRETGSRIGELAHLICVFVMLPVTIIYTDSLFDAKWLITITIVFHIYPVFLQRYNRPRYLRVINKMNENKKIVRYIDL